MKTLETLINELNKFKDLLSKSAEAGPNPKVMSVKKPLSPKDVEDAGPSSFKISVPKDNKAVSSTRIPISDDKEVMKFDSNGQWKLDKAQIVDMKSRKVLANLPSELTKRSYS